MSEKEFHPGDEIGGFAILAACGAGAFGQVYLVRDAKGRRFALKVLSPDRRGERELAGLMRFQRVKHPDLLHIDRVSTLPNGRVFYTMDPADNAAVPPDYVPDTLARRLLERGAMPPSDLKRIMLELASGAAALHRAHLLHRDIKPENILFVGGKAVLADAGAVGDAGGTTLIGTPDYLPPEVCLGKRRFTAADDCYALGKILYTALTGEPPRKFPSTPATLDTPEKVALFEVAERACTPPGLSVYEFRRLLEHPEMPRTRRRLRYRAVAAVAVGLVLLAVVFAVLAVRRLPVAAPPPVRREEARLPVTDVGSIRSMRSEDHVAFAAKMKADGARLHAEIERTRSPKVLPVGKRRRDSENLPKTTPPVSTGRRVSREISPQAAEIIAKYALAPEDERLVDKWMAIYETGHADIRDEMARGNDVKGMFSELKARLPRGIYEFCHRERLHRLVVKATADARTYDPLQHAAKLEEKLSDRRAAFKTLFEKLPADELAKWR